MKLAKLGAIAVAVACWIGIAPPAHADFGVNDAGTGVLGEAYQVSGRIGWMCLDAAPGSHTKVSIEVAGGWLPNEFDAVEMGIIEGRSSDGGEFSRQWFNRRATATYDLSYAISAAKPSRATVQTYPMTIRYDRADWRFFIGNTQVGLFASPDFVEGISFMNAGGTRSATSNSNSGSFSSLSWQRWGESTIRSGWPNYRLATTGGFTSHTQVSSTTENHAIPNPPMGCS